MQFYKFSKSIDDVKELINHGYTGALFVYITGLGDFFTKVSRDIKLEENFKYMVAVRPYTISPQLLCMINDSINNIDKDRLEINIVSGSTVPSEIKYGGILGEINDSSSKINKSNYLIKYVDVLEGMNNIPDYYVSIRSDEVVNETLRHSSKLLIDYQDYKNKTYDIEYRNVMIHLWLILRETKEELDAVYENLSKKYPEYSRVQYFTYKEFSDILDELKNKKINKILFYTHWSKQESEIINKFVKEYKQKELVTQ
jgi:hypothetical protein